MTQIVLVTGGAGRLGRCVLGGLSEAGWRTRALVHRTPVEGADEVTRGALEDPASLRDATAGAAGVLHLAARTHARRVANYRRTNVDGTAHLVDAAAANGVKRFVHVSTRAVSPSGGGYSRSKLDAEALVRAAALEHVIVRLPEVYGTGGREGMDDMLARAKAGAFIPVIGKGLDQLCPVHVDDVTGPLVAALSSPAAAGRTYTLAGECLAHREIARMCTAAFGSDSRLVSVPAAAVAVAGRLGRVLPLPVYPDQLARLRSEKAAASPEAQADLGFRPRGLQDGLRLAVASGV